MAPANRRNRMENDVLTKEFFSDDARYADLRRTASFIRLLRLSYIMGKKSGTEHWIYIALLILKEFRMK